MKPDTVLALESAIGGGSVALTAHGAPIANWHSLATVSRSEELLVRIAQLLDETGIERTQLLRIAVSNGPGSYTGLRIGLATAMGLARSLDIPCIGVSILQAIAGADLTPGGKLIVVPIGRNACSWQRFHRDGAPEPITSGTQKDLETVLIADPKVTVLAQADAFRDLSNCEALMSRPGEMLDLGRDLAVAVGLYSESNDDGLRPFYARDVPIIPGAGALS